ncbi:hypothetical protein C8J56DRAFT_1104950 [Mycena floridula]|nr:hypothetical protein C8J56DRAFT_1104950 [Mycena floridula]
MADLATEISQQQDDLVPPIDALPNELLEHIFPDSCQEFCEALDAKSFSWLAGQVCRKWREIALSLPMMWNQVNLGLCIEYDGAMTVRFYYRPLLQLCSSSTEILQERLRRSKNSSLQVRIHYDSDPDRREEPAIPAWNEAFLHIKVPSLNQSLLRQVHGRLSRLERLKWDFLPRSSTNFIAAPNLRELDVPGLYCTRAYPRWSQLRRITITFVDPISMVSQKLSQLQSSRELRQLDLGNVEVSYPRQPDLEFNHLRVLHWSLSMLDAFLKLPALENLDLNQSFANLGSFRAFIQRTAVKLRSLTRPHVVSSDSGIVIETRTDFERTSALPLRRSR